MFYHGQSNLKNSEQSYYSNLKERLHLDVVESKVSALFL